MKHFTLKNAALVVGGIVVGFGVAALTSAGRNVRAFILGPTA